MSQQDREATLEEARELYRQCMEIAAEHKSSKAIAHILKMARAEAQDALDDLKTVDPTDAKKIITLQMQVQRPDDLLRWLNHALLVGQDLEATYGMEQEGERQQTSYDELGEDAPDI